MNKVKIFFIALLAASTTHAQVEKVDLSKDLGKDWNSKNIVRLYEPKKSTKGLSKLSRLKDDEIHLRWNECVKLAPSVFQKEKDLQGWVANTWLHCQGKTHQKKKDFVALDQTLQTLEKHSSLFLDGPWAAELWQQWSELQLSSLEVRVQKNDKNAAVALDRLLAYPLKLTKEQKSLAYQLLGDLALARTKYSEAVYLYQQAAEIRDSKYLTEKMDFLNKALSKPVVTSESKLAADLTGDESVLEERMSFALKNGESVAAIKDLVSLLNEYPGSSSARKMKDRPLEIYYGISDSLAKEKALNEMNGADAARLFDWAQSLHRRSDFKAALILAKVAAGKSPQSGAAAQALWVAGRSAHFMGQYDQALESFAALMKFHGGTDEATEAAFRSALIYFRKKEYSTATALLEKMFLRQNERYDLVGQYWNVRALEKVNKERAQKAAAILIERYPFSYYGLRLRAEANANKLTWPAMTEVAPALNSEVFWVGAAKLSWKRFLKLSQAGWIYEAHAEWKQVPLIQDPTLQVKMAQLMVAREQYMPGILLLNQAMENDPRLRREEFIKIGYPQVFASLYKEQADRYKLDANILRSLTRQESAFNLRALSTSNAMGLMQMISPTAQEIAKKLGLKIEIPEDLFRPEINIPMGSFYVSQMLGQFNGNIPFALAAYNAGPTRLKNWVGEREELKALLEQNLGLPEDEIWYDELPWSETSFYVKAILRNMLLYKMTGDATTLETPMVWQDFLKLKVK